MPESSGAAPIRSRTVYRMMLRLPGGTSTPALALSRRRPPRIPAPAAVPATAPRNLRRFMLSSRLIVRSFPRPPVPASGLRDLGPAAHPAGTLAHVPSTGKRLLLAFPRNYGYRLARSTLEGGRWE